MFTNMNENQFSGPHFFHAGCFCQNSLYTGGKSHSNSYFFYVGHHARGKLLIYLISAFLKAKFCSLLSYWASFPSVEHFPIITTIIYLDLPAKTCMHTLVGRI